jgi:hypothetical protein
MHPPPCGIAPAAALLADYMAPEILRCPYKSKPEENKEKEHLHYGGVSCL